MDVYMDPDLLDCSSLVGGFKDHRSYKQTIFLEIECYGDMSATRNLMWNKKRTRRNFRPGENSALN